jgi:hypothetical protein
MTTQQKATHFGSLGMRLSCQTATDFRVTKTGDPTVRTAYQIGHRKRRLSDVSRLVPVKGISESDQVLGVHANDAPTRAVDVRYGKESNAQNEWKNQ